MPIIRSSRVLYSGCCVWYFMLWFFQVAGLVWSWGLCVRFAGYWFTLLHIVGILFTHINDDARSKSHQTCSHIFQMNPVCFHPPYFLKGFLTLSCHFHFSISILLLPSYFPEKKLQAFLISHAFYMYRTSLHHRSCHIFFWWRVNKRRSTNGGQERCVRGFRGETWWKETTWKT